MLKVPRADAWRWKKETQKQQNFSLNLAIPNLNYSDLAFPA